VWRSSKAASIIRSQLDNTVQRGFIRRSCSAPPFLRTSSGQSHGARSPLHHRSMHHCGSALSLRLPLPVLLAECPDIIASDARPLAFFAISVSSFVGGQVVIAQKAWPVSSRSARVFQQRCRGCRFRRRWPPRRPRQKRFFAQIAAGRGLQERR